MIDQVARKVAPIKPSQVERVKVESVPDEVLEVLNALIVENFNGHSSTVLQKEVVAGLKKRGLTEATIFDGHWLDVEDMYRKAGWKVRFDQPGYNEDYKAYFVFTVKNKDD